MKEIIESLETIKTITIGDNVFNIEYTQGGDLKWIALTTGINAANSDYPCPWCHWNKKQKLSIENDSWSIDGRSLDKARLKFEKIEKDPQGYINMPLFKFIEYRNAVIDPLHMCLRITDTIFAKLINYLDNLENKKLGMNKRPFLKRLNDLLEKDCGITSPFYSCKNEQGVKLRSLNQNERLKILTCLKQKSLLQIFTELKDDSKLIAFNTVLRQFHKLFMYSKNDFTERDFDSKLFKIRSREWLATYMKINEGKKLTPYVHSFVFHVPEFIQNYKNLNLFSTQALEKLNNVTKTNFFKNTNKRNTFLQQLLEKANRVEFITLKGTTAELFEKIKNN